MPQRWATTPGAASGSSARRQRAGELALRLLADPLNTSILQALAEGPARLAGLRRRAGLPAPTTLRERIAQLQRLGALAKREHRAMPYAVDHELTDAGRDLLFVADVLERWLVRSPNGPIPIPSEPAKGVIWALADGWGSTMLSALAARPSSLTELDAQIGSLTYPALRRRLAALRDMGQVERQGEDASGIRYAPSVWGRRAAAPLAAAARCELVHIAAPSNLVAQLDLEAGFRLAAPLVLLPETTKGRCLLAAHLGNGEPRTAAVCITIERGRIVSCAAGLEPKPETWALGSVIAWLDAVIGSSFDELRFGGDRRLALSVGSAFHEALFGPEGRKRTNS